MQKIAIEMEKNEIRQYFDDILNKISQDEFLSLLKEVEPFSKIGPEVMHYMQYTQSVIDVNKNSGVFSFGEKSEWFDPDKNISLAA